MVTGLCEQPERAREPDRSRTGLSPSHLLELPEDLRGLMQEILRRGEASVGDLAKEANCSPEALKALLQRLMDKGYVTAETGTDPPRYKAVTRPKRARRLPSSLWENLSAKPGKKRR